MIFVIHDWLLVINFQVFQASPCQSAAAKIALDSVNDIFTSHCSCNYTLKLPVTQNNQNDLSLSFALLMLTSAYSVRLIKVAPHPKHG